MPVRKAIAENNGTYFITFTCTNWLPLVELTNGYEFVYKWFVHLETSGHKIIGYVIMPNHLHAIINFEKSSKAINSIVSNGKRFLAYDIVKKLEQDKNDFILTQLSNARNATEIRANKKHKVFETSFDWKSCESDDFAEQKLQYLHSNPNKGKWKLVENFIDYKHSSARYYNVGEQGVFEVTHYKSLGDE